MTADQHRTPSVPTTPVAHSVPNKEQDSPEIREALMKYRPVNVLPADWDRVKDFCREAVLTYGPANAKIAVEMLSTVTLFVIWATSEEYAPLDYEGIFHPALMGRYLRSRVTSKNSSAYKSLHSRLFRIASAVAGVDHHKTKRGTAVVPVREYTAAEVAELEGWAATQSSPERRRYAYITLALMGGAGLAMTEALGVRGQDIHRSHDGYIVRVEGRHARTVPVHTDWQHYLDEPSRHFLEDDHVLFPRQTLRGRGTTLRALYSGPHPAPNPQWLRDSWLLQLIRALPLSIVMQSVGTSDVVRFRRYFDTGHLDFAQWKDAVRNPAAYGTGVNTVSDGISAHGDGTWRAAYAKARDDVATATVNLKGESAVSPAPLAAKSDNASAVGTETPRVRNRALPCDRDRGNYERRPMTTVKHAQALTADCTAFPAGTPAAPFKSDASMQPEGGKSSPVEEEASEQRHIEALEANWTRKRTTKKSRYEALPPGDTLMPATQEALAAAATDDQPEAVVSQFEALRAALLAEARKSARGGKR
jgi:hypothetical protein